MFAAALRQHQAGQLDQAITGYARALALKPDMMEGHNNLGNALRKKGQLDQAIACFCTALELRPDFAWAHYNLGNAYMDQGRPDQAVICFRAALALKPDLHQIHYNLANALMGQGRLDDAVISYRTALAFTPDYPQVHNNLGNALMKQGLLDEAVTCFRKAIALDSDYPDAHVNLGCALRDQGRLDEAVACYDISLTLNPDFRQAHNNRGIALMELARLDEAVACYHRALALKPDYPEAYLNLGTTFREQRRLDEAIACFRRALDFNADDPDAHNGLGNALRDQGQPNEAVACYRRAIEIKPLFPEAHNNLGNALKDQGLLREALAEYSSALEIKPGYFAAYSNQLFAHNYLEHQPPEALREIARQYGALVSSHARQPFTAWREWPPGPPLRIGLMSSDLRNHPVGYFLEALLGAVDPARIEFVAFPSHHGDDELTARIKPHFQAWKPINGLDDEAAARLIHDSGVQILLDLSGHTAHNRLPVFAWRPAPVQVTWLGYFATTGVAEIDYVIGDPNVAPAAEAGHFTETVWRLPDIYYCFTPPAVAVEVSDLPALSNGHLTFGCFNNLTKLNDAVLAVWARLLQAVPESRLMLKAPQLRDASVRDNIRARFAAHGIIGERLLIELPSSRAEYLHAYHRIDIALDPFPYPGGTTSFEALWMGLPVLTMHGDRFLSHAGETILRNAGLPDWIATDGDDYVAKAVHFASDLDRLASLRAGLRAQVLASPLFDAPRFARHFEDAMWGMWRQRQDRQKAG